MKILLVQVPTRVIRLEDGMPDPDNSFILEHLVRFCARLDLLPAIGIAIDGGTVRVVRGHKYLMAAQTLGRPAIRAVIMSPPTRDDVKRFLTRRDVLVVDWEEIRAREESERTAIEWHTFFFRRPLSPREKTVFGEEVRALFGDRGIEVVHDDAGPLAEFEACTPVNDECWPAKYLGVVHRFHREHVCIVSYRGRRFDFEGGRG